jgi:hypothetical protein
MARTVRILAGWIVAASLALPQAPPLRPNSSPANARSLLPDQNAGEVIGPDNFIFSVADLDRSVALSNLTDTHGRNSAFTGIEKNPVRRTPMIRARPCWFLPFGTSTLCFHQPERPAPVS